MDLKMILLQKDNYSEFCREAIIEKLDRENDSQYIELKIKEFQNETKKWQGKKQIVPTENKKHEILERWLPKFNEWKTDGTDEINAMNWIRNRVLPDLKRAGCKDLEPKMILNMFLSGRIDA